jgi:hypothetical protein
MSFGLICDTYIVEDVCEAILSWELSSAWKPKFVCLHVARDKVVAFSALQKLHGFVGLASPAYVLMNGTGQEAGPLESGFDKFLFQSFSSVVL